MGSSRARRFAAAAVAALLLASISAVLVATAAPKSRAAATARTMNFACASDLYNARKVMHFVARPASCRGSGRRLINFAKDYPVYTCRKEHGGFAARQKRFQFPNGIYGHGPAGLMRWVRSLSDCAPNSQPNETPITLPTRIDRFFCAAKRGGELRWVTNTSSCNSREFPVRLRRLSGGPVANADQANTDEDHGTTVSVLANDRNTPSSHSSAGLQVASTDTTGTTGAISVNPDGTISYSPNGQFETLKVGQSATDTFKYRVKRGTRTSAPATVTIKIDGVNDLPVASNDSATTDSAHTKSIAVLANDSDVDGDSLSVSVDTAGTQGNVTVNSDGTVTYDPNHKFDSLGPNDSAHDTFKYKANDGHGDSNVATVDVTIGGIDDPPVVSTTSPATPYTEGAPATVVDGGVTVSDPDNANLQSARIAIVDGHNFNDVLELPTPAPGGITGFYDINAGVLSLTGDASKADWQAALRTVTFQSNSDNPFPTKQLEFKVNDGNSDSAPSTKTITTTNVNDPPQVVASGGTSDFVEDSPPVAVDPGIDVSDPDSLQLQSATVAITGNFSSADGDTLAMTPNPQNGITGTYNSGTGVLTLTGVAAISDYQTAIQSITFSNTSNTPSTADRTVSITIKDAEGLSSNTDTRTVTVAANNDAPVNNLPGAQSLNEDGSLTLTGATKVSVSDADAGSDPIKVDLSVAHGKLDLSGTAGLTVTGDGTGSVSATGSQSNINTALDGLKYTPTADYNGPESLGITTNDQGHNPAPPQSTSSSLAITVNAVNDAPVNTVPGAQVTGEDTAITFSGAIKPSVSDIDAGSDPIKVTLSVLNGKLDLSGTAGLTVTGDGTATVTATGSQSDINTALDGLKYTPNSNYNGADTLQLVTDDQGENGSGGALTDTDTVGITVNAVNDAPVNSLPAPQSTSEDTALTLSGAAAPSVNDVDAGSDEIKVTLSVAHGTLDLGSTAGLTVTGDGSATVEAKGSQSDINTALNGLKYTPTANYSGPDALGMTTDDQGHNPAPPQTDTDSVGITVNAVNDAPVNTVPAPQTTNEDTALTLSGVNAPSVSDVDAGSDEIQVTLSVNDGVLDLGGTAGLTVTGNGTDTVVAKGSQSDLNTGLDGLKYTPDSNFNGSDTITMVTDDQGHNPAPAETATSTIPVTVNAVNDAPVNTVPDTVQPTNEDTTLTFSSANSNAISVADADAGAAAIKVDLTVSNGTLTLSGTTGLSVTGDGTATVSATGSQADINTALNGLQYAPTANYNGSDSLQVKSDDQGNTGAGGSMLDIDNVSITVNAVNDAPANTVPGPQATSEDIAVTFSTANSNQISVADLDAAETPPGNVQVDLTVSDGTLTLSGTAGLTVSGQGTDHVTATGTVADLNTALNGLVYQPGQDFNGGDSLQVQTDDLGHTGSGGAQTDTDSVPITVTAVNDAPVVDLNGPGLGIDSSATFLELTPTPVPLAPLGTVSDVDSPTLTSLTVTLTNPQAGDTESLAADPGTTGLTVDPYAGGVLLIHGSGTAADYQTVLRTVTYSNSTTPPNPTSRDVTFVANDGTADSTPAAHATVAVVPIDDPPVVDLNGGGPGNGIDNNAGFTEDQPAVAIAPSADVSDTDDANLESMTVTLTNRPNGIAESLLATATGGITVDAYNSSTGVLLIHGTGTVANYQTILRSVKYDNTSNTPNTDTRDVTVVANDGQENSPTATSHVSVTPTNDAPTLDLNGAGGGVDETATYTEDQPAVTLAPNTVAADLDSANLQSATITLTNHPDNTAESLSVDTSTTPGITAGSYDSGTGVLTLTGPDTVAHFQEALQKVKYLNTSQNANTTPRVVDFVVNDGTDNSNTPHTTVTINVINDPPVVDMNGGSAGIDSSAAFTEDSSPNVVGSGPVNLGSSATVSDVDNAQLASATLTLSPHPDNANESLSVNLASSPNVTTAGYNSGTGVLTLTGPASKAEFEAAIQSAKYNNTSNTPDPTTRHVATVVNDGTANSTAADTTITVTPTNDAPTAGDETFNGTSSAIGNTTLGVDNNTNHPTADGRIATPDPTDASPATDRPHKEITGNIFANDNDPDNTSSQLTAVAGTFATNDGGTVTIQSDGDFLFEPAPSTSCTDTSDFFDYTVQDSGSPNGTDTGRVTVAITGCVWYVNNGDAQGNNGTSEKPFDTLAQAETASGTGHSIFVYDGDNTTTGYNTGINLKANQQLIGEAATLTVGSDTLHTADAANKPSITDNNADVVDLDDNNTVKGFNIDPQGTGGGIAGSSGDTGGGTIDDVNIVDGGTAGTQPGLDLTSTTGTFNISNLTVNNGDGSSATNTDEGVLLSNAGTVNFNPTGTISITTNGAKGLDASSTNMGAGSVFDDITVTNSGSGGVNLSSTSGSTQLGDGSGTDLALTTVSGAPAALNVSSAGTVSVPSGGTANLSATGGPAADVSNTSGSYDLDTVSSTNSTTKGINLDTLGNGNFTAGGGTISGAAGNSFDLNGGTGNVTYPGSLADGNGSLTAEITGHTGGTVTLSGQITDDNDAGGGISFTGNTGGTAVVTNANNVVDTGAATAIDVENTTIGASGVNFKTASSNGAANGIKLATTGSTGGLNVTSTGSGTCAAAANAGCTGGSIQNSTAEGVLLTSVGGPVNLTRVSVNGGGNDGIRAASVGTSAGNGIAVANSFIGNNGNAANENGLDYDNVLGISSINAVTATGNGEFNARIDNDNGIGRFTVSSSIFSNNSTTVGADGLLLNGDGNAQMRALVQNNTFNANRDDGFQLLANSDSSMDLQFNNNNIDAGGNAGAVSAHSALNFDGNTTSDVRMSMTGGTVINDDVGISGSAIIVNPIGNSSDPNAANSATFDATFDNVTIGTAGVPGSGSATGQGFRVTPTENLAAKIAIKNSHINGTAQFGALLRHNDGGGDSDFTFTGNTITTVASGNEAIFVQSGSLATDATSVCADIGGTGGDNTNPPGNTFAGVATGGVTDIAFRRPSAAPNAHLKLPGFSPPASTNLQPYIQGRNVGNPTALNFSGELEAGPAACQQPTLPTAP